ncbi:DUF2786 domain-containing protein [Nonomuraea sp. ZG12]|uniref:DUF2786 domain-containing protein n=1 Tax=Nonomuraea sp. ZG12 TaxID=3452207 RepID=UPI003F88BB31
MEENKTMRRVRLLIAKAEGTDNAEEAKTFMSAAMKLMAKHGIERTMLKDPTKREELTSVVIEVHAPYAPEKRTLLNQIARNSGVYGYTDVGIRKQRNSKSFFYVLGGYPSDIEEIQMLFTSLLLQSANELARAVEGVSFYLNGPTLAAWKRTFLMGYAAEVGRMIREARERAVADTPNSTSTAVALVDKQAIVKRYVTEGISLRKPKRKLSGNGYREGQIAGKRADLGGTAVGPQAARVLHS